jgi:hypothetical protein
MGAQKERRMSLSSHRRATGIGLTLLLLGGCNASQTQSTAMLPNTGNSSTRPGSIRAGAQSPDLLYAANRKDGSVDFYVLATGKLQGRLSNVRASGVCANGNGAVFITSGHEVLEYAHGGTRTIAVLHDLLGAPLQACAADAATGDLAVTSGTGRIAIFADAKGNARALADGGRYSSIAYDDAGNLFVASARTMKELSQGAAALRDVVWSGARPSRIGAMQWDGRYLAIESEPATKTTAATISRYAVNGTRLTFVDSIVLQSTAAPLKFAVLGEKLFAPATTGVAQYGYPQGGRATTMLADPLDPQFVAVSRAPQPKFAVTTYHDDNYRTGWDNDESALTEKTVKSNSFGLLASVPLDDQVDAQPLIVPSVTTTGGTSPGEHDVVYVVTENDSVYAIDASSGQVLIQKSLGAPVQTPLGCTNNGPNVGITGTPVIDVANGVMYVVAYTTESKVPTYRIHELSLADLTDVVPSVVVSATQELTNDTTFTFNATYQRQRPALLEADGNVYAGFGSFCDYEASHSRGWLLGWQAGTLTPLAANELTNRLATSPNDFFLSSIWMSGDGPATDASGNIYFVTGNSDYSGTTYNGVTNVNESVVKMTPDLSSMLSIFTPSNVASLDEGDEDFGSGGVLVLPTLKSTSTPLAAAAGKDGNMYVMNQNDLGGYGSTNHVLAQEYIGGCWCGQSYYAYQKHQRVVASGGNSVTVWDVKDKNKTKLSLAGTSQGLPGAQDPGFFTSVSSTRKGDHVIIWALARPQYTPGSMSLYALQAEPSSKNSQLQTLYETPTAGYWNATNGDANLVPVVANGKVYVASYKELNIFGLGGSKNVVAVRHGGQPAYRTGGGARVVGTLVSVRGSLLSLKSPTGAISLVDDAVAVKNQRTGDLVPGELFIARGRFDARNVLHAVTIIRAKRSEALVP